MVVASVCAGALLVALCRMAAGKSRPLDTDELRRVRSFSDRLRREETQPYFY